MDMNNDPLSEFQATGNFKMGRWARKRVMMKTYWIVTPSHDNDMMAKWLTSPWGMMTMKW